MKYSAAYLLTLALGAQANCPWTGLQRVDDGWFVQCTPKLYRQSIKGDEFRVRAESHIDCAKKCMRGGYTVCSYSPQQSQCVFGREDGETWVSNSNLIQRVHLSMNPDSPEDDQKPMGSPRQEEKTSYETELADFHSKLEDLLKAVTALNPKTSEN
ncbi:hypothetical protein CDV36_002249 [Fusarium kuroshium]|uniref:Apple domain-containing protein n=1 Tax=Fusarium kuroshium TaxID=2010991 RepID=A0A3M2SLQ1_9HYPO|nr:hypothetical protein CDV36_002249 [Fusarium kuroshium]